MVGVFLLHKPLVKKLILWPTCFFLGNEISEGFFLNFGEDNVTDIPVGIFNNCFAVIYLPKILRCHTEKNLRFAIDEF